MTSPYHAHFELRERMRRLVFWLVLLGLAPLLTDILFPVPFRTLVLQLAIGLPCLGLAWGIHAAREWARIAALILFGVAAVLLIAKLDSNSFGAILPGALCVSLALPATKKEFADARVMLQRTAEIRREKANARKLARQRIAERRRENASSSG